MRNAERNAPWFPERPPKKPESSPPSGRYFDGMASAVESGAQLQGRERDDQRADDELHGSDLEGPA